MTNPQFAVRLREIIRQKVQETGSPDQHVVAQAVIDQLTPQQQREALEICLVEWVRNYMASLANRGVKKPQSQGISKQQRIKQSTWYRSVLDGSLAIGDERKFFGDCSAQDLHVAAAQRYQQATDLHTRGDQLVKIALFMEENGLDRVSEISEPELTSLMGAS